MNFPAMPAQECIPKLKALADDTRWRLVHALLRSPATVNELTEQLRASQYNVSKHLTILESAGIIIKEKDGKHVRCTVTPDFLAQLDKSPKILDLGCCTFSFDQQPR
jgi:DNA-binding transcriptional ArsR family regulator